MPKAAIYTLGCKVNQYESQAIIEQFKDSGYEIVDFDQFADIYIINTCTVTNLSDRKSRQAISKAKAKNNDAVVVVTGCYSQASPQEVSKIEGVNLVVGTNDRLSIIKLIEEYLNKKNQINIVDNIMNINKFEEMKVSSFKDRTRAFIKIQEGCNQYCSYCIIPYARGKVRSRKLEDIINEVKGLAQSGFKEIVLTGIHIASYGKDMDGMGLIDVINGVYNIEGILRIRLGSLEPTLITKDFINSLKSNTKLCPHFHLSLQSGCNETLKRMNRKYDVQRFKESVDLIREQYLDASIATDIIVGFPGENHEEFEKSLEFAKEINFSKIHVFKYSPRKGTPAAKYPNQIDPKVKEERSKRMIELSDKCEEQFYKRFIGTVQNVIFEQRFLDKEHMEGLTPNYIRIAAKTDCLGEIQNVRLIEVKKDYIYGEVLYN